MRTPLRVGLAVVGLVLVVGGGIAAVSPRTAQLLVNRAAARMSDSTPYRFSRLPAIDAGVYVGREKGFVDSTTGQPRIAAMLEGASPLLRNEAFIASSRQESRTSFRVWGVEAQVLGLLLMLAAGLTGRRRLSIRPNRPATPVEPTAPTPPVSVDPPVEPTEPEKQAEPAQPAPAAVTTATDTVHDGTGGDLDPAPQPEPPVPVVIVPDDTPTAPETPADETSGSLDPAVSVELTVRVTRPSGIELTELSGSKLTRAETVTIKVGQATQIVLDDRNA